MHSSAGWLGCTSQDYEDVRLCHDANTLHAQLWDHRRGPGVLHVNRPRPMWLRGTCAVSACCGGSVAPSKSVNMTWGIEVETRCTCQYLPRPGRCIACYSRKSVSAWCSMSDCIRGCFICRLPYHGMPTKQRGVPRKVRGNWMVYRSPSVADSRIRVVKEFDGNRVCLNLLLSDPLERIEVRRGLRLPAIFGFASSARFDMTAGVMGFLRLSMIAVPS